MGRCDGGCLNLSTASSCIPEEVAFLGLMHRRANTLFMAFGLGRRGDPRCIHNRATQDLHAVGQQQLGDHGEPGPHAGHASPEGAERGVKRQLEIEVQL